jgi:Protein of unknown function (DUF2848)
MALVHLQCGKEIFEAKIEQLVIAGWTGRNKEAVEHHIHELEKIGVARPKTIPCFYRVAEYLISTNTEFQFTGADSSGEVEYVIFSLPHGLFIGVGSDHTDRKVEAYGVTVSKQMCPKPVAKEVWSFETIKNHWDQLITRSWVTRNGVRELYQEGALSRMLTPQDLITQYTGTTQLPVGTVMFCGTHSVLGEIGGGEQFEIELFDPVTNLSIKHAYHSQILEIVD